LKLRFYIFILFIAGCASTAKQSAEALSPTHGYLFVHFPMGITEVTVIHKKTQKIYDLKHSEKEHENVTGLWLPPGMYDLKTITFLKRSVEGYPSFEVKKNRVTSLGSLVELNIDSNIAFWLPKNANDTKAALQQVINLYSEYLVNPEPINWAVTTVPKPISYSSKSIDAEITEIKQSEQTSALDRLLLVENDIDKFYILAKKTLPPLLNQEIENDNNGNSYIGSYLGQIKKRTSSGKWLTLDTGSRANIDKVYWHQNKLFSADANGRIFYSENKGHSWQQIHQLKNSEELVDIDAINGKVYFIGVLRTKGPSANPYNGSDYTVNVYQANTVNINKFKLVHSYTQDEGWGVPKGATFKNKYYLGLGYNSLEVLDSTTNKWSNIKLPDEYTSFNLSKSGVITLLKSFGAFSKVYISLDDGVNWNKYNAPSLSIHDVIFSGIADGVAFRQGIGVFSFLLHIQKYDLQSDKWVNITSPPKECLSFLKNNQDTLPYCVTKTGRIFSYDKTWTSEQYE
jgi:hypothetical protein